MGSSASFTSGANKYLQYLRNISKYIFQVWSSLANLRRTWGCDVVLCVWIKYDVYPRPLSDQPSNPQSSPCSHLRGGISPSLSLSLSLSPSLADKTAAGLSGLSGLSALWALWTHLAGTNQYLQPHWGEEERGEEGGISWPPHLQITPSFLPWFEMTGLTTGGQADLSGQCSLCFSQRWAEFEDNPDIGAHYNNCPVSPVIPC